ncbi:hypothetical protein [Arthrobacter sp.]|uniref:hypothetical protein n=1 Tax=Arthrobacter sp. TaxID=1667 RepID=UPI003A8C9A17
MDNHFVPNLTLGLPVVQRLEQVSRLPLDVHLMIGTRTGGHRTTPTSGSVRHLPCRGFAAPVRLARELRSRGTKAAMALRPATAVEPYLTCSRNWTCCC